MSLKLRQSMIMTLLQYLNMVKVLKKSAGQSCLGLRHRIQLFVSSPCSVINILHQDIFSPECSSDLKLWFCAIKYAWSWYEDNLLRYRGWTIERQEDKKTTAYWYEKKKNESGYFDKLFSQSRRQLMAYGHKHKDWWLMRTVPLNICWLNINEASEDHIQFEVVFNHI